VFGTPLILPGQFLDSPEIPPKIFLEQFSKTLSKQTQHRRRRGCPTTSPAHRWCSSGGTAMYRRSSRRTTAPTPSFADPFTTSRCASATRWIRCLLSDSNHARTLQRRRRYPGRGAARPPPSASGISRRRGPSQPAGCTSPQSHQPNRAGNRFPLARRQGFLHAPPPFSTTSPLDPLATAERRQD
jgi:hypothetical protein